MVNQETMEVDFIAQKCVACGLCESACPMKALSRVNIERLGEVG